jgi:DNA-binding MarR family transcriptional regulator
MQSLGRLIWEIQHSGQIYIDRALRQYDLGNGQYRILNLLYNNNGLFQEEIARYLRIDKAAVTKAVQKLLKEEYIRREVNSEDRRVQRVYLTEKSITIQNDLLKIFQDWEDILLNGFDNEETAILKRYLQKMVENAQKNEETIKDFEE